RLHHNLYLSPRIVSQRYQILEPCIYHGQTDSVADENDRSSERNKMNRITIFAYIGKEHYESDSGNKSEEGGEGVEDAVLPQGRVVHLLPPIQHVSQRVRRQRRRHGIFSAGIRMSRRSLPGYSRPDGGFE
ncbi:unnamed protein product, partial [Musa acuminata subsp. burmannicoides]